MPETDQFFLEQLKNRFLAAIYQRNPGQARQIYLLIVDHARQSLPAPGEACEKILRQVQAAAHRYKEFFTASAGARSCQALKPLLADLARSRNKPIRHVSYAHWESSLDLLPWQMNRVFQNAITVQLTSGCSHFCRRCNEWALPGLRSHFSYPAAARILAELAARHNTDPALYGASDPLDWKDGPYTLADLLTPFSDTSRFSVLTKVPRGSHGILNRLIRQKIALSVSVTTRNRNRISLLETQAGLRLQKQHDSDDLLIPAGLDEDFCSVKSSITDAYGTEITPEGAAIIIPTFTSALYPMGHKKIPVTRKTTVFPVKKIGRRALLVDYFKPLEILGKTPAPCHLPGLVDVQVETMLQDSGSMDLSPPGMRNLKEYFTIFDEPARLRRKQMTPSVIQGLTREFLSNGRYRDLSGIQKQCFRQKISAHVAFCKKQIVTQSRICAVAFFLGSAMDYLAGQKEKKTILAHLIKAEADRLEKRYGKNRRKNDPERLLFTGDGDFFDRFRFYLTGLIFDRNKEAVRRFVQAHPAVYDPVADRFTPALSGPGFRTSICRI